MKGPLIREKDFQISIGQGEQTQRGVMETYQGERNILCFGEGKGGEWMCEKNISSYVWKGVVHGKYVCKQKHGRKLCVRFLLSSLHT